MNRIPHILSSVVLPFVRPIKHLRFIEQTDLMRKKVYIVGSSMVANLPIEEFMKEDVHVFRVAGRLDETSAPILERKLEPLYGTPDAKIVVDFKNLNYLSSAGMRVMLAASKRLKASKGQMVFSSVQPPVMEIIKLAGFEHILKFYPSEVSAMKAVKSHPS